MRRVLYGRGKVIYHESRDTGGRVDRKKVGHRRVVGRRDCGAGAGGSGRCSQIAKSTESPETFFLLQYAPRVPHQHSIRATRLIGKKAILSLHKSNLLSPRRAKQVRKQARQGTRGECPTPTPTY